MCFPSSWRCSLPDSFGALSKVSGSKVEMCVGTVVDVIFERTVTSIKVTYFTIFYTQITHSDRIADDLRPQLVQYLRMGEAPADISSGTEEVAPV